MIVPFDKLKSMMKTGFEKIGMTEENADCLAENLATAEARGVYSHGVAMASRYAKFILDGQANPNPQIKILNDNPSSCVIDGDRGMGAIVLDKATDIAMEKARATGSCVVCVINAYHYGAGAYFVEKAARNNMMAYLFGTNTGIAPPFGGVGRYLGTNPFTFAAPGGKYSNFVVDMATTMTAMAKVRAAVRDGKPLPEGCAIDAEGNPTTNPEDVINGGALLTFGGHRGYGIAYMNVVAAGVLSGARYKKDEMHVMADQGAPGAGCFLQVTDISKFMEPDKFKFRMGDMIDELKSIKKAPGVSEVYFPGEIEGNKLKESLKNGVNVTDSAYALLTDFLKSQGCDV